MLQTAPAKRGPESGAILSEESENLVPEPDIALLNPAATAEAVIDSTKVFKADAAADLRMLPRSSAQSLLSRVIETYKRYLELRPHLTNAVVAYVITTMGDASAQFIQVGGSICSKRGFDIKRNMALALTASLYNGLILTTWLLAINKTLPGTELRFVLGKLAATQTILQPLVYVPFFFIVHGVLCGQSLAEIRCRIRSDYFALLIRLWSLFYPTRFMMFWIVPAQYQVLWDSTVAFIWQVALSLHLAYAAKNRQASPSQMMSTKTGSLPWLLKTRAMFPATAECAAEAAPATEQ